MGKNWLEKYKIKIVLIQFTKIYNQLKSGMNKSKINWSGQEIEKINLKWWKYQTIGNEPIECR